MLQPRLPIPRFLSAGELFLGPGSLAALRALTAARVAIYVSRTLSRDAPAVKRIAASIGCHESLVIAAPAGEPSVESLAAPLAEINGLQPDWIVAVGGGSVVDGAKLLWIFYEQPDIPLERLLRPFGLPRLRGKCRLAAVPTTAGTGSEVSSSAVLSQADGRKRAVVSHELLPDVAILDPTLTAGVPRPAVAAAGLDALSHAVESYVSRFANPLADVMAESAARIILEGLPRTWADPADLESRLAVMQAAMIAGWVQNLKVPGIGHAIAHQMGRFGIPHGFAAGALLVPSIRANSADPAAALGYQRLAARLGFPSTEELCEAITRLRTKIEAASGLKGLASKDHAELRGDSAAIAAGALADPCARANPRTIDPALVAEVLEQAL